MTREISSPTRIRKLMDLPDVSRSRVIVRDIEQQFSNECTRIVAAEFFKAGNRYPPLDAQKLFSRHWDAFRAAFEIHRRPGLLLMALDELSGEIGRVWIEVTADKLRSITVGRHARCDLVIPEQRSEVSLRHLLLLARRGADERIRTRLIELRTETAFSDESGRLLNAAVCEDTAFLRLGSLVLVLLPTSAAPVAASADDAYAKIPKRLFLDERTGFAPPGEQLAALADRRDRFTSSTAISSVAAPEALRRSRSPEPAESVATLRLHYGRQRTEIAIAATTLERGILIGRYSRCDLGFDLSCAERLSRVHCLIIQDHDGPVAIDTASSNRMTVDDQELRVIALTDGTHWDLANELELTWLAPA